MLQILNEWLLTPWRLAIHVPTATAVLADVHLGYSEARRRSGEAVPLVTVQDQLRPLRAARQAVNFRSLIVAGDMFERAVCLGLLAEFRSGLADLEVEFTGLIPGNHDRGWPVLQDIVPLHPHGVMLGEWRVIHGETETKDNDRLVIGHWHPALRWQGRRRPCYLAGPRRLVLPAFSQDAAGYECDRDPRCRGLRMIGIVGDEVVDAGRAGGLLKRRAARDKR